MMFQRAAYIARFKFNLKNAAKKNKEDKEVITYIYIYFFLCLQVSVCSVLFCVSMMVMWGLMSSHVGLN